jgi:hypothetical protein
MNTEEEIFEIVLPSRTAAKKRGGKRSSDPSDVKNIKLNVGAGEEPDSDDDTETNTSDTSEISIDNAPVLNARHDFKEIYEANPKQLKGIKRSKKILLLQSEELEDNGEETYENQRETAQKAVETFKDRNKVIQVIVGRTQSGKTGCMLEFIKIYIDENLIPVENIYLITGLSSKDWEIQCKGRFPECICRNIYHNGQMARFKQDVEGKQDLLILIDEAHMACLKKQTMNSMFKELNWKLDFMMENDIKLVQFSATPDGILFALNQPKWPRQYFEVHTMNSGVGYYGPEQMKEKGNLLQFKNILGRSRNGEWIADQGEILSNIEEILRAQLTFTSPKYIIFRILGGCDRLYEENVFDAISTRLSPEEQALFNREKIMSFYMDGNVENINALLFKAPRKHTIIFIKEKMKCAQTLEYKVKDKHNITTTHKVKPNIGVMVERWSKSVEANRPNDSFIIQGFLGRLCGYENHDIICFTNLASVDKYETLFETGFDEDLLNTIGWNSNSTRGSANAGTRTKPTFNSAEERMELEEEDDILLTESPEPTIASFSTQLEAKEYCKSVLGSKTGPRKLKVNLDGFYTSTIRSLTKVWYEAELHNERKWGLKYNPEDFEGDETVRYRYRACYTDVNDNTTVQFWIIHY